MTLTENEIKAVLELATFFDNCDGVCNSCEFGGLHSCIPLDAQYLKKRRRLK